MSWSVNLFVDGPVTLDRLAEEIGIYLGRELKPIRDTGGLAYELRDESWLLTIGKHNLINDRNMSFEQYPYQISIWSTNYPSWEESQKKCYELARALFERLKATGMYRLMLTKNLQVKLDAFDPV